MHLVSLLSVDESATSTQHLEKEEESSLNEHHFHCTEIHFTNNPLTS